MLSTQLINNVTFVYIIIKTKYRLNFFKTFFHIFTNADYTKTTFCVRNSHSIHVTLFLFLPVSQRETEWFLKCVS